MIRETKKRYYDDKIQRIGNNSKKLWNFINAEINTKTRNEITVERIHCNENGDLLVNPLDISNEF